MIPEHIIKFAVNWQSPAFHLPESASGSGWASELLLLLPKNKAMRKKEIFKEKLTEIIKNSNLKEILLRVNHEPCEKLKMALKQAKIVPSALLIETEMWIETSGVKVSRCGSPFFNIDGTNYFGAQPIDKRNAN